MSRINEVSKLFTDTKEDVLKNISNWQDYLTTASKLYKYSFDDQIMIYAQRPDATACANQFLKPPGFVSRHSIAVEWRLLLFCNQAHQLNRLTTNL